ncbi:uncharacterized protein [Ptychodera flava]|uniref:uncharacterized protein n=1 Tax=Ptychodera flava TaxID=63121 RepID=UPI00396A3ADF
MYATKWTVLTLVICSGLVVHETVLAGQTGSQRRCGQGQDRHCFRRRLNMSKTVKERSSGTKPMPSALLRFGKRRQNTLTVAEFNTLHSINKPRRVDFIQDRQLMSNQIGDMGSEVDMLPTVEIKDGDEEARLQSLAKRISNIMHRISDYFPH